MIRTWLSNKEKLCTWFSAYHESYKTMLGRVSSQIMLHILNGSGCVWMMLHFEEHKIIILFVEFYLIPMRKRLEPQTLLLVLIIYKF